MGTSRLWETINDPIPIRQHPHLLSKGYFKSQQCQGRNSTETEVQEGIIEIRFLCFADENVAVVSLVISDEKRKYQKGILLRRT